MAQVPLGRRDLLLTLIGVAEDGSLTGVINGITRLQKFLFLLEWEEGIQPIDNGFEFTPYKAGPYSKKLYDDLELLENLGLVTSDPAAESTLLESTDISALSFEDLIVQGDVGPQDSVGMQADSFEERKFALTAKGKKRIKDIVKINNGVPPLVDKVRVMKGRFSHYSLTDLLRYVYSKYPKMTTESEIIDKIMGKRRR